MGEEGTHPHNFGVPGYVIDSSQIFLVKITGCSLATKENNFCRNELYSLGSGSVQEKSRFGFKDIGCNFV